MQQYQQLVTIKCQANSGYRCVQLINRRSGFESEGDTSLHLERARRHEMRPAEG